MALIVPPSPEDAMTRLCPVSVDNLEILEKMFKSKGRMGHGINNTKHKQQNKTHQTTATTASPLTQIVYRTIIAQTQSIARCCIGDHCGRSSSSSGGSGGGEQSSSSTTSLPPLSVSNFTRPMLSGRIGKSSIDVLSCVVRQ